LRASGEAQWREVSARRSRIIAAAVSIVAAAVVFAVLAAVAWRQTSIARAQLQAARAREVASIAETAVAQRLDTALLLAVEANVEDDSAETRAALYRTVQSEPRLRRIAHGFTVAASSHDGSSIAMLRSADGALAFQRYDSRRDAFDAPVAVGRSDSAVSGACFLRGDGRVAVVTRDGFVRIVDAGTGAVRSGPVRLGVSGVRAVACFGDRAAFAVAAGTPPSAAAVDATTLRPLWIRRVAGESAWSVAVAPHDGSIAVGGDGAVVLLDPGGRMRSTCRLNARGPVSTVGFTPSGDVLAGIAGAPAAAVLHANGCGAMRGIPAPSGLSTATASADGTIFIGRSDGTIASTYEGAVTALHSWPPSHALVPAGSLPLLAAATDAAVDVWATGARYRPLAFVGRTPGGYDAVATAGDASLVVAGPHAISFWTLDARGAHAAPGAELRAEGEPLDVLAQGDGRTFLIPRRDGVLDTIALRGDHLSRERTEVALSSDAPLQAAALTRDGRTLVAVSARAILSWSAGTVRRVALPHGASDEVSLSPHGRFVAVASHDARARGPLLVTSDGTGSHRLTGAAGAVVVAGFSDDERTLIVRRGETLELWDTATFERRARRIVLQRPPSARAVVAVSHDARLLAVATDAGGLQLYDVQTGLPLGAPLPSPGAPLARMRFGDDDALVVAITDTRTVAAWETGRDVWRARACKIANRDITAAEWDEYGVPFPFEQPCRHVTTTE
jgi:WD40 repeat protein